jgi:hypothetical protein
LQATAKLGGEAVQYVHREAAPLARAPVAVRQLKSVVVSAPEDIRKAVDAFVQLEAEGWKGRHGTALLSSPQAFPRAMLGAFGVRAKPSSTRSNWTAV